MPRRQFAQVPDEIGEQQADPAPHADERRERRRPEAQQEHLAEPVAVAVVEDVGQVEQAAVAGGDRDVGRVQQLGSHDEHRDDEDAGDQIGHAVVDSHHLHESWCIPALLPQPVAVGGESDGAAHTTGERQRVEHRTLRKDRAQPQQDLTDVGHRDDRRADDGDEHDPDQHRDDLLEGQVAAEPHHRQTDETRDHRDPAQLQTGEQRDDRQRRRRHRGGAVDEPPDDDVRREIPGGPATEATPALEDAALGRQRVAAGRLDEDHLEDRPQDRHPQQRVAVAGAGDQRRHQVGRPHTGGGHHQARADEPPPRTHLCVVGGDVHRLITHGSAPRPLVSHQGSGWGPSSG